MKTANKTFPKTSVATDPLTGETFISDYDIFTIGAGYLDLAAALADRNLATEQPSRPRPHSMPAPGISTWYPILPRSGTIRARREQEASGEPRESGGQR